MTFTDFLINFLLTTASVLAGIWASFHFYVRQQSDSQAQKYTEINQSLTENNKWLKEMSATLIELKSKIESLDKAIHNIDADNDQMQRELLNVKATIALVDRSTNDVAKILANVNHETTSRLLDTIVLSKNNEKTLLMDKTTIRIGADEAPSINGQATGGEQP